MKTIKVGAIRLVTSDVLEDWYTIEHTEHEHKTELRPVEDGAWSLYDSARISDASVEGTSREMCDIASAIRRRGVFHANRCAVEVRGDVFFWSPRNSSVKAKVSISAANALAEQIENELGKKS